jgi:DNA-binding MarR family transcriptional regulator
MRAQAGCQAGADNDAMPDKRPPTSDLTPRGGLDEAGIHDVFGYQLAQATTLTTAVFTKAVGLPYDLRPVEFTILQLLQKNETVTVTKLAQALSMTVPGVGGWLERLEKRELLRRERSETDRRAQHLQATEAGRLLAAQALQAVLQAENEALRSFSEGERRILLELLQRAARLHKR